MERAAAGEPQQFEWLGRRRDGGAVWLDMRLRRVRIGDDDRILATARDIGARKAAEDALRDANEALERRVAERTAALAVANDALSKREEHFRRLIENASDQVLICDTRGAITYVGPSVERILGFTPEEMMGLRPTDNMHPDDLARVGASIAYLVEHPGEVTTTCYRIRHKDGAGACTRRRRAPSPPTRPTPASSPTPRHHRPRRGRARPRGAGGALPRMIEHASDFVMIVDGRARSPTSRPRWSGCSATRRPSSPGSADGPRAPEDVPAVMDTIARLLERPTRRSPIQYRMRHKDGRWRWIENVANTFVRGSVESGLMANCRDITERVEAERALRERDTHFRRLIENASDHVMIVDASAAITYVAPSVERMLGWTPTR
jgi:PAS domain S-box-containing protein